MRRAQQRMIAILVLVLGLPAAAAAQLPPAPAEEKPIRWQHGGSVTFVGFAEGGKQLVSACQDGYFRVWEVATAKELRRFGTEQKVDPTSTTAPATMALSRDGRSLAVAGPDGTIRLWETATGKELRTLGIPPGGRESCQPVSLVFAPDARILAVRGPDHIIRLFAVDSGKELRQIGKPPDPKLPRRIRFAYGPHCDNSLAFSPDGKTLITAGVELEDQQQLGVIRLWAVETGKEVEQAKVRQNNPFFDVRTGFGVASLAFVADDKILLAWASSDGTARLHELSADKEPRRLPAVQQGVHVALVFSPDAKSLAVRASNSPAVRLYDTTTGKERILGELPKPAGGTLAARALGWQTLAFSPDGKVLAEGLSSGMVRLWDVASGKEIPH